MVAVATTVFELDDEASATCDDFWGQLQEMCPFLLHWKHLPSFCCLVFSSSVIVALACALVLLTSIVLGSQWQVRALVHCSLIPPITCLPTLSWLLNCMYSSCCCISVLTGCLTHLGPAWASWGQLVPAGASWYNTLKLASCHVHRPCPNPLQSPHRAMTSK